MSTKKVSFASVLSKQRENRPAAAPKVNKRSATKFLVIDDAPVLPEDVREVDIPLPTLPKATKLIAWSANTVRTQYTLVFNGVVNSPKDMLTLVGEEPAEDSKLHYDQITNLLGVRYYTSQYDRPNIALSLAAGHPVNILHLRHSENAKGNTYEVGEDQVRTFAALAISYADSPAD